MKAKQLVQCMLQAQTLKAAFSWLASLWICYVFLGSLPYKFSNHPDTQHIFGTIGEWMAGIFGPGLGQLFATHGAKVVGSFELLTSLLLLLPALLWVVRKFAQRPLPTRAKCHAIGGLAATAVMSGAVFFHMFTPLGIEVLHQGKSDGGSLFYAAVSIWVLGIAMFFVNWRAR